MDPERLKERLFRGAVLVVMATPFKKNGEVNIEGLRLNTGFLLERAAGSPLILVPTGSTGEFYALSDKEYMRVVKTVVEEAGGRLPVIVGASAEATGKTLALCKHAEDVGADGVMVVLPYYFVPSEEGMYQHYKTIANGIDIGVLVYNNPDTTKCHIRPKLMAKIAEIAGIVGVKENTKNLMTYYQMTKLVGEKIPIICGTGEFWYALESLMGCPGFVSSHANYAPEISLDLLDAGGKREFERAWEVIERMRPIFEFGSKVERAHGPTTTILPRGYAEGYMYVGVVKAAMDLVGIHGGYTRLPIQGLTDIEREELKDTLTRVGILPE